MAPATLSANTRRSVWRRLDIAITLGVYLVVLIAGSAVIAVMGIGGLLDSASDDLSLVLELVISVAATFGGVGLLMLFRRLRLQDVDLIPLPAGWAWKCIVLAIVLLVVRVLISSGLVSLFPWIEVGSDLLEEALVPQGALAKVVVFLLGGLIAPVGEELLFRGVVFGAIRARRSFWGAAVISSLVFGAFHLIPLQAILAAVLGLALCWTYERTHTLTAPILVHIVNNVIAFGLTFASLPFFD